MGADMTCLFTGQNLGAHTKEEHTIPRALAGRVRSQSVSSAEFNNLCGIFCDPSLVDAYKPIMEALSPLLAREHRPGRMQVEVPGELGDFAIDDGSLTRKTRVEARDIGTHRPTMMSGNPDDLKVLLERLGLKGKPQSATWERPAGTSHAIRTSSAISPIVEIAALKSALLTFDAKLQGHHQRFTRSPKLREACEFILRTVKTGKCDPSNQGR